MGEAFSFHTYSAGNSIRHYPHETAAPRSVFLTYFGASIPGTVRGNKGLASDVKLRIRLGNHYLVANRTISSLA